MHRALALAARGRGRVHPNPLVGAVLVKGGRIIGEGYHGHYGGPHAEVMAVRSAVESPQGATLYVTLEPCAHRGKTPACTELLIKSGIKHVCVGAIDPNPLVHGRGIKRLRAHGIRVRSGLLEADARRLNHDFEFWIQQGRPRVTLKAAQSLDGKIATRTGQSRWISSAESREIAHRLRASHDAVLVGIGTVLADDPHLTARPVGGRSNVRQPLRIVLDSRLRTPLRARILSGSPDTVWIVTGKDIPKKKAGRYIRKAKIVRAPLKKNRIDLEWLMMALASQGIRSLLVEGGGEVLAEFIEKRFVDEVCFFIAPKVIGGSKAPGSIGGLGIGDLSEALTLRSLTASRVGPDIMIKGIV